MLIRIRTFARFREVFGDRFTVEVPEGSTLLAVIKTVENGVTRGKGMLTEPDQTIRKSVIILQNGRRIPSNGREETPICEGDELTIYPPVAGG